MRKAALVLLFAANVFAEPCPFKPDHPLARFFCGAVPNELTARIKASVPEGNSLFVYVPRTSSAVAGNAIPADTDLIPLLLKDGKITVIAPRVNVPAGKEAAVAFAPPRAGHVDVVLPLVIAPNSDPSVEPPQILINDREKPLVGLSKGTTAPSLLFFRDVVAPATLKISGKRWKTIEAPIGNGPITTLDPITAVQTSKVVANWSTTADLARLAATPEAECKKSERAIPFFQQTATKETTFVAVLYGCRMLPNQPNAIDSRTCKEVARHELDPNAKRGTVEFEDVAAGPYFVEFHYPKLPALSKRLHVLPQETTSIDFDMHYMTFFGQVTRGDRPLHASVFGTVTDPATGQYTAVVTRMPGAGTLEILPCDGSLPIRIVPDEAPKENEAFDIDLTANKIVVDVFDKATGAPVTKARVSLAALMPGSDDGGAHFAGFAAETDEKGSATIAPVLENRKIRVCASRDDYDSACAPDFTMKDVLQKDIRLDLTKVAQRAGRVDAHGPITRGWVVWALAATGMPTELRDVGADGTFTYKKAHPPGEIVMFTSADRAMYVLRQPPLDPDQTFDIVLPNVTPRNIAVTLATTANESASVALAIGDLVLPDTVLSFHLQTRRFQWMTVAPGGTLTIPDILATAPVSVILIPQSFAESHRNVPYFPDAVALQRREVPPSNAVTFP